MRLSFDTCPAGAAALWLLVGVLGLYLPVVCEWPAAPTVAALALAALILWRCADTVGRGYIGFLPLGAVLTVLHLLAPWQTYIRQLPRAVCGGELQAIVTDPLFSPDEVPALALPASVKVAARSIRFGPEEPWRACRGTLVVRLPGEQKTPVEYGTLLVLRGAFLPPEGPVFAGDFDYRRCLRVQGIRYLFLADTASNVAPCRGWRRVLSWLYRCRDQAMGIMADHLRNARDVQILSALLFGYQAAVAPDLRDAFLRSGTIHVLSVSGLHVVILSAIVIVLLRGLGVPFRWRYAGLPLLVGVYVAMTGGAPAAQRAWLMISLWALGQACLLPIHSLNSVAIAGLVLLLLNPLCVGQTGVQFSFVLVVALVGGWRVARPWRAVLCERSLWVPRRCRTSFWQNTLYPRLVDLATASLIGWLASAGLIAWVNGRFIPSALLTNLGIGVSAWLVLFLASLKLLLGLLFRWCWAGLDLFFARLLEGVLRLTGVLAEWGSSWPGSLPVVRPELGFVLLFYAALAAALLVPGRHRWRPWAMAFVILLLAGLVLRSPPVSRLALFSGDGAATPVVVWCGDRVAPVVINSGPRRLMLALEQWLTIHGFDRLEALVLPSGAYAESAKQLLASREPLTLLLPSRETPGLAAGRSMQEAEGHRVRRLQPVPESSSVRETATWSHMAVELSRNRDDAQLAVTLREPGHRELTLELVQPSHRSTRMTLTCQGETVASRVLPLSLRPALEEVNGPCASAIPAAIVP